MSDQATTVPLEVLRGAPGDVDATAAPAQVAAKPGRRAAGPVLLEHSYDGIQEYDNPLPGWWRVTFYASMVFAVVYWIWFHAGGPGQSEHAQYAAARKVYDDQRANRRAAEGEVDEATIIDRSRDPDGLARGAKVFAQYCLACHTENGRGLVGPNLTDDFQKHGHTRADVFRTVSGGVTGTAMIPWSEMLRADQVLDVVAFVTTLRGQNLPGGKAPEGERVEPFTR